MKIVVSNFNEVRVKDEEKKEVVQVGVIWGLAIASFIYLDWYVYSWLGEHVWDLVFY